MLNQRDWESLARILNKADMKQRIQILGQAALANLYGDMNAGCCSDENIVICYARGEMVQPLKDAMEHLVSDEKPTRRSSGVCARGCAGRGRLLQIMRDEVHQARGSKIAIK